jgi:hypothetical protein
MGAARRCDRNFVSAFCLIGVGCTRSRQPCRALRPTRAARLCRPEKIEALVVGFGVLLGLVLLLSGVVLKRAPLLLAGLTLTAGSIPGALIFRSSTIFGRCLCGCIMAAIYISGAIALVELLGLNASPGETGLGNLRVIL